MIKLVNKPKQEWVEDPDGEWIRHKSILKSLNNHGNLIKERLYELAVFDETLCIVTTIGATYPKSCFILMKLKGA